MAYKLLAFSFYLALSMAVSKRWLEYVLILGYLHKCMTTVLARPPGERSLAAVSS